MDEIVKTWQLSKADVEADALKRLIVRVKCQWVELESNSKKNTDSFQVEL